jgi:hypothetical protein
MAHKQQSNHHASPLVAVFFQYPTAFVAQVQRFWENTVNNRHLAAS